MAGVLPIAQRAAQQGGSAALSTQDDDVVAEREVPVPGDELDGARGAQGEDPVIAGFALSAAETGEGWSCCHVGCLPLSARLMRVGCNVLHCCKQIAIRRRP